MQLAPSPFRILLPALVLALFYWSLFRSSVTSTLGDSSSSLSQVPILSAEESRRLLDLSASLKRQGQWQQALEPSLKLYQAYPENHTYIQQLAVLYGQLGRPREEAQYWEKFMEHAPLPIEGCPQIGQAYQKQGLTGEAIKAYERCFTLDPQNLDSLFYLAHMLEMARQFGRAAELYTQGAARDPGYLDLRVGLARVRLQQGNYPEARRIASKILVESPSNIETMLVLGLANWRQGDRSQAKDYLERGAKLADHYAEFHLALGGIAEQENNTQEAIKQYSRVLELDPRNHDIAARRDSLIKGHR
jgi:tetratricopeptide (TPR) repeat protein